MRNHVKCLPKPEGFFPGSFRSGGGNDEKLDMEPPKSIDDAQTVAASTDTTGAMSRKYEIQKLCMSRQGRHRYCSSTSSTVNASPLQ